MSIITALAVCGESFASDVSRQMMDLRFSFTDYISYYSTLVISAFKGFPWVVRISYLGLLACAVTMIVFIVLLYRTWYKRRRNDAFYQKIHDYYFDSICEVMSCKQVLDMDDVEERTRYNESKNKQRKEHWKNWQFWQIGKLLMTAKSFCYDNYNVANLITLVKMFGMDVFADKQLAYSVKTDPIKALQMAQFLIIKVPESSLARLLNSNDMNLRKETRMYHMMIDEYNPFRFFEEANVDYEYRKRDDLEIHYLLRSRKHMKKPIPSLVPLILQTDDVKLKSCLIREVAFWGNQKDIHRMEKYFTGKELAFRRAAIQCMSYSKNKACEKDLMASYSVQPEDLRQEIIRTIYLIRSGEAADFLVSAYQQTVTTSTRYVALYFMYMYNIESRILFNKLEQEADEKDRLLFNQVRAYIELAKRRNAA